MKDVSWIDEYLCLTFPHLFISLSLLPYGNNFENYFVLGRTVSANRLFEYDTAIYNALISAHLAARVVILPANSVKEKSF
jgi:hypothetical protein